MTDEEFTSISLRYSDSIFRIAFNYCKNRADSDDIVQNVLIKFYKCSKKFDSEEHIRNWLIRVAINESKKLLISPFKKRTVPIDEISDKPAFDNQEKSDLFDAVMKLPKKYRIVVYMYYYEDYDVSEISKMLGVNSSTIRTQLSRARSSLKEQLQEVWADEQ
ncbi:MULTISPECIES: RNA polymerase sigma factor [unclassified Ruminococcus]|uniref:RNA polymerase sigma factor n=1 Tax=unclassified Ruminococcus TaxID=2608920 RepID=UPI00210ABE77|nr:MULTISPECIES: sigma-70 family RNA polymerase sigma factor [unclassified Ruminococcus]MCQ4021945.1 sigma-70 family RNA polymerase sigma factor [Ruminococcus sp. zg-924]MCQ4114481.1 sigma-70 family RNA polymerase sigma factor [Ruminococcus sp. zg-921]